MSPTYTQDWLKGFYDQLVFYIIKNVTKLKNATFFKNVSFGKNVTFPKM